MINFRLTRILKILGGFTLIISLNLALDKNIYAAVGEFYKGEDRYRGFYWFEQIYRRAQDQEDELQFHALTPTPEEAQEAIEIRKKALDNARSQMIELGFRADTPPQVLRAAIVKYKKLEAEMHDGAIRLSNASDMANFLSPEIANSFELPTNVFANKIRRAEEAQSKDTTIKTFAKDFDLLLFSSEICSYCKAFAPIIADFAKEHGFSLEVASLEGSAGKIAQKLGINGAPTLVAVSKDGRELFELARGYSTTSELETNITLASEYSKEQNEGWQHKGQTGKNLQKNRYKNTSTKYQNKR